ncbi:hypothetical protein OG401_36530 [Kitasatospora purpeofusca]|uniref:hypothetical protein n=1 Tax=Kitasatospora purpeofusca TaxID=67352 RepID=UPI002251E342|nr:hypothetical protein [Kitasatospora purpeofusca]MCX4689735.1 hypothetical protein [Kitasatospora purpeofusca]
MTTPAERRRRAALLARTDGLAADLDHWLGLTADAAAPFPHHHTQVRALDAALRPLLARVREGEPRRSDVELSLIQEVWCRLRDALAQRWDASTAPFLALADDFAWSCYLPALTAARSVAAADPPAAEPPLVHLTRHAVPFALPRPAPAGRRARAAELQRALPVPLVGLPFVQSRHLPETVLTAHEVGHCVLDAFGLAGELGDLLRRTTAGAEWWTDRLHEVFADLWGTLCAGSGFAFTLADFVALTPDGPPSDRYPVPRVRVALVADTLAEAGHEDAAAELRALWNGQVVASDAVPDVLRPTVRTLLTTPLDGLGGSTLLGLFPVVPDALLRATSDALLRRAPLPPGAVASAGLLVPAAALAFHVDPDRYTTVVTALTERVHDRAAAYRERGVRGSDGSVTADAPEARGARAAARLTDLLDAW